MEKKFPTILKKLRKEKNLSQEELAKKFNLTSATISRYEIGIREPDQELLQKFANFFNVSIDYLLGRTNIPNQIQEEKTEYEIDDKLTDEELNLIQKYRQSSDKGKKIIKTIVEIESGTNEQTATGI